MANSPLADDISLTSFIITSDGQEIPDAYQVSEINIRQKVNRIAEAEIELFDGNPAEQNFEIAESKTFVPGAEIEIKLGYDSKNDSVYKGVVVKQTLRVSSSGSVLVVSCRDKAQKLTLVRKNMVYVKQKDSDIIAKIIGDAGLSSDVESTMLEQKEVVQYNCTEWDFIVSRAEANGLLVNTNNNKLEVNSPDLSGLPTLSVTYGYDIIEFDGELDATFQYSDITAGSWDMSTQVMVSGDSSEPGVNDQGNLSGKKMADVLSVGSAGLLTAAGIAQDGLKVWSNAALLKSRLSRFRGTLRFQGSPKAKVNSLIKLNGLSDRFNGNAFVSGVNHHVQDGRWLTEVEMGLAPNWFSETHNISALGAAGLTPDVKGLQTGVVKKIDEDPDNEFRVQVTVPILGGEAEAVWARLSSFYAGNTFGAQFMPEIGDEVVLGFMAQDPSYPIILGSLFSSKNVAPNTPDDKNTLKTITTKSQLKFTFDDDKKTITLETPAKNTVVISDDAKEITITDQSSNSITMSESGIAIESKSSLSIKAAEDITINGATISAKGDSSVEIKSTSVEIKGDADVKVSGEAQCEVSSSGQMTVKGAMVSIN
ncbi:type VI secretion system tip protein VgrG [Owenweeksia hongkongensis]|uniref:type VI secretion system tip protein VgrG n=1 Tax=Owenweeksia hongkongensis TaxID=253245 RepID=UPI003A947D98